MMRTMSLPPRPISRSSCLLVGKDHRGRWVVRNEAGTSGGFFIDRAAALRFAMLEIGDRPQALIMVPGTLEARSLGDKRKSRSIESVDE